MRRKQTGKSHHEFKNGFYLKKMCFVFGVSCFEITYIRHQILYRRGVFVNIEKILPQNTLEKLLPIMKM